MKVERMYPVKPWKDRDKNTCSLWAMSALTGVPMTEMDTWARMKSSGHVDEHVVLDEAELHGYRVKVVFGGRQLHSLDYPPAKDCPRIARYVRSLPPGRYWVVTGVWGRPKPTFHVVAVRVDEHGDRWICDTWTNGEQEFDWTMRRKEAYARSNTLVRFCAKLEKIE